MLPATFKFNVYPTPATNLTMDPSLPRHFHQSPPPPGLAAFHPPVLDWDVVRPSKGHHSPDSNSTMVLPTSSPMPTNGQPVMWSRGEVQAWLKWCQEEFSLDSVNAEKFSMNGKALCLMPKQSFCDRAPDSGDVLYELLQKLLRKECRFYHSALGQETTNTNTAMLPHLYLPLKASSQSNGLTNTRPEHQSISRSPTEQTRIEVGSVRSLGDIAAPPATSSPRLPMDLSAPEKSNTPCSDSGHSSPDTAEDLRLSNNPITAINRRLHVQAQTNNIPMNRNGPLRSVETQMRTLGGKYSQDCHSSAGAELAQSMSPTKRFRPAEHAQQQLAALMYTQINGHVEPRHDTSERLNRQGDRESQYAAVASRLMARRTSVEGLVSGRMTSSLSGGVGVGGAYRQDNPSLPVLCPVSGLNTVTAGAVVSRLHHRRNSTGGTEGIRDSYNPSPQHTLQLSNGVHLALPRRQSIDLEDVFTMDDEVYETRKAAGGECRLLWDFLVQLLKNKTYTPYIRWENKRERVFRILDPVQIANLWGLQKNRTNMTYEKLSRALRYYYKMGILQKEQGQKLTYRFLQDPKDIANSQRFSKISRNKDGADQLEARTASSPSSSPPVAAAANSPLPPSSSPGQTGIYPHVLHVPNDHRHQDEHSQRSDTTRSPSTIVVEAPPTSLDGVSMVALTSPWRMMPEGGVEGYGVPRMRVKEEPGSGSNSPEMQQ